MEIKEENTLKDIKLIGNKTNRSSNTLIEIDENEKPAKKFNSAESKKNTKLNNTVTNFFMAKIDPKYENKIFPEEDKLTGQKLIFECRRKKAEKLINNIKEDNDELKNIFEALKYDNTNKACIYKLLNYYYKKKEKDNFDEALNKYKYCITRKFEIKENEKEILIDLDKMYEIKIEIEELEELPNHKQNEDNKVNDLRNSMIEFFTSYYYIAKCINNFRNTLSEEELTKILSIKFTNSSFGDSYKLDYETNEKLVLFQEKETKNTQKNEEVPKKDDKKNKKDKDEVEEEEEEEEDEEGEEEKDQNLEEKEEKVSGELLLKSIENFLSKFLFYQDFKHFQMNQPVDYDKNLSLYYNYIIWSLYEITTEVNEAEKRIIFRQTKIIHYYKLMQFHNLLFDKYLDKEEPLQEIINQLLQYLLMALSSEYGLYLNILYLSIHLNKKEKILDKHSAKVFKKKLNKYYDFLKASFSKKNKGVIFLKEKEKMECKKIKIRWKNYTKNPVLPEDMNWIWKNMNFVNFQKSNFF